MLTGARVTGSTQPSMRPIAAASLVELLDAEEKDAAEEEEEDEEEDEEEGKVKE